MHTTTLLLSSLLHFLATAIPALETRQSSSGDDLVNGQCGDMVYIFARGTTERGNLGTVIGPGFGQELASQMGNVAVQGVDYPANIAGFNAGGSNAGATTMADLCRQAIQQCPGTPIVMSGYRYVAPDPTCPVLPFVVRLVRVLIWFPT